MAFLKTLRARTRAVVQRALFALLASGLCGTALPAASPPPTAPASEYQLKAVFLYNFLQFIEWPPEAFQDDAPICIGVLGQDPFGGILEDAVSGETVKGRKLTILRSTNVHDFARCQLVFISRSERASLPQVLSVFEGRPVLTVSDIEGFARRGGAINFLLEGRKVRLEINPTVAQEHGLKISSQLLSIGRLVGSQAGQQAPHPNLSTAPSLRRVTAAAAPRDPP